MWKYTGSGNLTRSIGAKWDSKEYIASLKKITMAPFSNLEEGLPMFTPGENPVPTVS
jgi:hypothetical protein